MPDGPTSGAGSISIAETSVMRSEIELLRTDAQAAFRAAVEAVRPENLMPEAVRLEGGRVLVRNQPMPEAPGRRLVAALGKAAPGLAAAWLAATPGWTRELFVLTPHGVPVPPMVAHSATIRHGAHPFPDAEGEAAARELLELTEDLGSDDLLVVLLSGGTSALLAAAEPPLSLAEVAATTRALLRAGAPIGALNTVRRQLLRAGGGGLAHAAAPAPVVTLVLSDVLGDPLPDIASGPTVPSPTGADDALAVLELFGVPGSVPTPVLELLRRQTASVADARQVPGSRTLILGNNRSAVTAACRDLERRGYTTTAPLTPLTGEASMRGRQLGALAKALRPEEPYALVLGGETTVTVRGEGRGGRNQELALAAALELSGGPPRVVLAAGTDGIDGLSEAAGAVVDPGTLDRLTAAGVDPLVALAENDSGTALSASGDAIMTGPTGTNVCDLTLLVGTQA